MRTIMYTLGTMCSCLGQDFVADWWCSKGADGLMSALTG